MNPFLEYLQTSGQALGRGARALNQYVDPWQYLDPKTVAGFAPGGGVVQGNQDILAAKAAAEQGEWGRAAGLAGQSALNTGLDLLPLTSVLPAINFFGGSKAPSLMDQWKAGPDPFAQSVAKSNENLALTDELLNQPPLPQSGTLGATPEQWAIYDKFMEAEKGNAPSAWAPEDPYGNPLPQAPPGTWDEFDALLEKQPPVVGEPAVFGETPPYVHPSEAHWTPAEPDFGSAQNQYKDVVEASFGTMDAGKAFYKEMAEKNITMDADEVEMVKALWPDIPLKVAPPPTAWPAYTPGPHNVSKSDPLHDVKVKRMEYGDEFVGPPAPRYEDLPMDEASRMARATEQGFTRDLWTGVPTFGSVDIKGFKDPMLRKGSDAERAVFLSDQPEIAAGYAGMYGPVIPAKVRMDNPKEIDWYDATGGHDYENYEMVELIEKAIKQGHDSMIIRGMGDIGGTQDQFLVFNPNQIRSKYARFDPRNIHANDLTAALAAAFGLGATVPHVLPEEAK